MDIDDVRRLLKRQDGVISRRQVLDARGDDNDIEGMVRRREWARVYDGVYVDHTGPRSWNQRSWAAVLLHWPAALAGRAALRAHGLADSDPTVIEVVIDAGRRVHDPDGIRTSRLRHFSTIAQMNLSPPRVRVEQAVLVEASRAFSDDAAVAVIGDACQRGRSTAARLALALGGLPQLNRRRLLLEVISDVAAGALSALERRYLVDVERRHGLPVADRQVRVVHRGGATYRDVHYRRHDAVVELDGGLGHESTADRWADLQRDLDSTVLGEVTLRAGWRQVLEPCRLAGIVAAVLIAGGWEGRPMPCGPDCGLDRGDTPADAAGEAPQSAA